MQEIYFIQEYYYYLLFFLLTTVLLSFILFFDKRHVYNLIFFLLTCFSLFTVFYIGGRENTIGVDTYNYNFIFDVYKDSDSFVSRKDFFFDFFTYSISKSVDFYFFLIICAFIYIFGAFVGLKRIFQKDFYLPFLLFLISPYFFQFGINVMRNGIAASLLLITISCYHNGDKKWKVVIYTILALGFHISMIIPIIMFVISKYIKKIEFVFFFWLVSILFGLLNINLIAPLANLMVDFSDRVGSYSENTGERSSWGNFLVFGVTPVLFAMYTIVIAKFKNPFFLALTKTYMLTHTIYIMLINTEYALRFGYLAEFMMPILLFYPLFFNSSFKTSFIHLKVAILLLVVFLIKAYKIFAI